MRRNRTDNEIIPLKIVIIDDSEFARKMLLQVLESEKYNVVGEVATIKEATEIVGTTGANLLIIDVVMPEMNGIELTRKLKEIFSDIYVIMMSSLAHDNLVLDAITAGASDFLHKPFTKKMLLDSINKIDQLINS